MKPVVDETHDPARSSWVASAEAHPDFPIQNLPLGIFSTKGGEPRPGIAIGEAILDLAGLSGMLTEAVATTLAGATLNALFALPGSDRLALRRSVSTLLSGDAHRAKVEPFLHAAAACTMHLPARIGDYTDFYVGIHHATNVGRLFRPDSPLLPNYKHVPIGYHGRASSVRVSGAPVRRPLGQRRSAQAEAPEFGPSRRLDYELELGLWIGEGNSSGAPIPIAQAGEHVVGVSLLNDWSTRDVQAWEYQPLGPFLSKSFHTTISPWVVTAEALAPFRVAQAARPEGDPRPLPYLWDDEDQRFGALSIDLEVSIATPAMREAGERPHRLSHGSARDMYWTPAQLVAHHSSNGCDLHPGDLFGTGTLSGATPDSQGSLLELTRGGGAPISLPTGETRTFLEDGDEVILSARAHADGGASIGFGPCRGIVEAARPA